MSCTWKNRIDDCATAEMKHYFSRYVVPAISLDMRDRVVNGKSALFRQMSKKGKMYV